MFIGPHGISAWMERELNAFIKRECPIFPILLPTLEGPPELPIFLDDFQIVDFRKGDPDPLEQLIWGITDERGRRRS